VHFVVNDLMIDMILWPLVSIDKIICHLNNWSKYPRALRAVLWKLWKSVKIPFSGSLSHNYGATPVGTFADILFKCSVNKCIVVSVNDTWSHDEYIYVIEVNDTQFHNKHLPLFTITMYLYSSMERGWGPRLTDSLLCILFVNEALSEYKYVNTNFLSCVIFFSERDSWGTWLSISLLWILSVTEVYHTQITDV